MYVYIIEVESGSSDQGNAMVFDSVWSSKESAETYAKERFSQSGWGSQVPDYTITETILND